MAGNKNAKGTDSQQGCRRLETPAVEEKNKNKNKKKTKTKKKKNKKKENPHHPHPLKKLLFCS
jgi:hypothetical protein